MGTRKHILLCDKGMVFDSMLGTCNLLFECNVGYDLYSKVFMGNEHESANVLVQGVPYATLPRRDKPRRVDLYFSSWVIKPGEHSFPYGINT